MWLRLGCGVSLCVVLGCVWFGLVCGGVSLFVGFACVLCEFVCCVSLFVVLACVLFELVCVWCELMFGASLRVV